MFEPFEDFSDIDELAARLADPDPAVRRVAVMELADTALPEAIGHIGSALKDQSAEVRLQAAIALGEFDGPLAAEALAIGLQDADSRVAQAAADSLAELKDPAAAAAILPLTEHENRAGPRRRASRPQGIAPARWAHSRHQGPE
jgi:HEAT repeat protein